MCIIEVIFWITEGVVLIDDSVGIIIRGCVFVGKMQSGKRC